MLLNAAIERLYDLNLGVTGVAGERHERPHKPLLLLAALDLIDEGLATLEYNPDGGLSTRPGAVSKRWMTVPWIPTVPGQVSCFSAFPLAASCIPLK